MIPEQLLEDIKKLLDACPGHWTGPNEFVRDAVREKIEEIHYQRTKET